MVKFLARLSENSQLNKMTAANLAIVIAPSLLWAPPAADSTDNLLANSGFVIMIIRCHICLNFFSQRILIDILNSLPSAVNFSSLSAFKRSLGNVDFSASVRSS